MQESATLYINRELIVIIDVNECHTEERNNCDQICINTIGSYNCSCGTGYLLNEDGYQCDGIYNDIIIIIVINVIIIALSFITVVIGITLQISMNVWRKAICVSTSASTPMALMCVTAMKAML